jgi:hypothetical protein
MVIVILIELQGMTSAQIFEEDPQGARQEIDFWQSQGAQVKVIQALDNPQEVLQ